MTCQLYSDSSRAKGITETMSNGARRQRRTVPLCSSSHHADGGNFSLPTDECSMPTTSTVSGTSTGSSAQSTENNRSYQIKSDISVSTRRLEPIRQSFANDSRQKNVRGSLIQSSPGISTSELRRSIEERLSAAKDNASPGQADPFTTPRSSRVLNGAGELTNFISLEQVLESSRQDEFSGSFSRPSFTVRTPFEVDAPRGETPKHRSSRLILGQRPPSPSGRSVMSDTTNPNLSKEQDAWAGIDALLESRSLDDSFCYSTSEILPKATVKALRRETKGGLRELDEETVWGDEESDAGESRMSKRSLESISKASSTSSNSSRLKGNSATRKSKTEAENDSNHHSREGRRDRRSSPGTSDAGLFDMFQWSDKDNVDAERIRKGKLNSKPRKTINLPVASHPKESQEDSDTTSLPSLASYRPDDFSVRSGAQSVGTYQSHDYGSVVTENSRDEFGDGSMHRDFNNNIMHNSSDSEEQGSSFESDSSGTPTNYRNSLAGDGLVLDKGVDEYIRKIQKALPTIAEDEDGSAILKGKKKKKHVFFAIQDGESSPSPTSVIAEGTAFDELPSIVDLSSQKFDQSPNNYVKKQQQGRKEEKKEQSKPSLTFLMSSIKKMTTKPKSNKYLGDEEKYFPEAVRVGDKAKKYRDNRCLLNQGDDGVNWDTD